LQILPELGISPRYVTEQVQNSYLPPEAIVSEARQGECTSIAYTYSEPVIFYEYMIDIARLARRKGLKSVVVTNAFINPNPSSSSVGKSTPSR